MTARMLRRAEAIARKRQSRIAALVAERVAQVLATGAVELQGTQVIVRGRGLLRRWLTDPDLRFVGRTLK